MSGVRVLIVDDEPMIRLVLGEALRDWGYEVAEAGTGEEAMKALVATSPALVLLDIKLPDSSGLDLLRDFRRHLPQTAIVMITGEILFEFAVDALRGGADDFVCKPINLQELRYVINRVLEMKRRPAPPAVTGKPSVLVVADTTESFARLLPALRGQEVDATSIIFPEEWTYAGNKNFDLAIAAVGAELLEPLLDAIRNSPGHAEIPILVDNSRLLSGEKIAGVMPAYRAMACSQEEMNYLIRRRIIAITERPNQP